ncbi:hypothetical protein LGQ03_07330 [Loktanella sp. TSTF-M6]|uniref:Transposase n=1 Tax=Loktanella gaetbuli TaxID=2881335 RepID=A0ABS8BTI9_9RHOB|nr:hypothetical protein [Loktanella gaetbuli]MCB5199048.1 hypothetical protein [Loktanella gaetbuli]
MIRTADQSKLRYTLQPLTRGHRRAVFELMRSGTPLLEAVIIVDALQMTLMQMADPFTRPGAGHVG